MQPELASDRALQTDPRFAKYSAARQMLKDGPTHRYEGYVKSWDKLDDKDRIAFMNAVERGQTAGLPKWQQDQATVFRNMLDAAHAMEQAWGSTANYVEDYLPHLWDKPDEVKAYFQQFIKSLGPTWFQKQRSFNFINQGLAAGFHLRETNPAQLVLQRLYASADMIERMKLLNDLQDTYGVAKLAKDDDENLVAKGWTEINAPDRQRWLLAPDIQPLWMNAIEAKGLWGREGIIGSAFRGWMAIKNVWVPIKLAGSLFHPVHIFQINAAQAMSRAERRLFRGEFAEAGKAALDIVAGPVRVVIPGIAHLGKQARAAWLKAKEDRTPEEEFDVQRMADGGFVPQPSQELRINGKRAFEKALAKQDWVRILPAGRQTLDRNDPGADLRALDSVPQGGSLPQQSQ